jgi:peptidoglycan/xylan/chitin deacetylase (PgdA/CDA1 family)
MFKVKFHLVIYRYEIILAAIILLLTGGIVVSSKDKAIDFTFRDPRYPYKIALSFDDGPHPDFTDRIVGILRENKVPATFFVVGRMALEYPQLVEELSVSGNEVEGHSYNHNNLTKFSEQQIIKDLNLTRGLIEDLSGKKSFFFRPPGGNYDLKVVKAAGSVGEEMVLWSVFPKDHEENDPKVIVDRVLKQAADGGVVLLHSGREPTLIALPVIIKELRERGYQFVSVMQLRSASPPNQYAWLKKGLEY